MENQLKSTRKITPFLWFDNNAEEAMNFYVSIFKDASISKIVRNPAGGPGPEGTIITASFELLGQQFAVLNGGPQFKFNEAISFAVSCANQDEIDYYWTKLTEEGEESRCGWLKDKFGLSWQIVPENISELLGGQDAERAGRVMQALFKMNKLDIATLEKASQPDSALA